MKTRYIIAPVAILLTGAFTITLITVIRCLRETKRTAKKALTTSKVLLPEDRQPLFEYSENTVPMLSVQTAGCAGMERLGVPARTSLSLPPDDRGHISRRMRVDAIQARDILVRGDVTLLSDRQVRSSHNHYYRSSGCSSRGIDSSINPNGQKDMMVRCPHHISLPDGEWGQDRNLQLRSRYQQAEITRSYITPPPNKTVLDVPKQSYLLISSSSSSAISSATDLSCNIELNYNNNQSQQHQQRHHQQHSNYHNNQHQQQQQKSKPNVISKLFSRKSSPKSSSSASSSPSSSSSSLSSTSSLSTIASTSMLPPSTGNSLVLSNNANCSLDTVNLGSTSITTLSTLSGIPTTTASTGSCTTPAPSSPTPQSSAIVFTASNNSIENDTTTQRGEATNASQSTSIKNLATTITNRFHHNKDSTNNTTSPSSVVMVPVPQTASYGVSSESSRCSSASSLVSSLSSSSLTDGSLPALIDAERFSLISNAPSSVAFDTDTRITSNNDGDEMISNQQQQQQSLDQHNSSNQV